MIIPISPLIKYVFPWQIKGANNLIKADIPHCSEVKWTTPNITCSNACSCVCCIHLKTEQWKERVSIKPCSGLCWGKVPTGLEMELYRALTCTKDGSYSQHWSKQPTSRTLAGHAHYASYSIWLNPRRGARLCVLKFWFCLSHLYCPLLLFLHLRNKKSD